MDLTYKAIINKTTFTLMRMMAEERPSQSSEIFFDKYSFWKEGPLSKEERLAKDAQIHMLRDLLKLERVVID